MPTQSSVNSPQNSGQPQVARKLPPPPSIRGIILPRFFHPVAQGIGMVVMYSLMLNLKNSMIGKILVPALLKTVVQITGNILGMISPALIPFASTVAIGVPLSLLSIQLILAGIEIAKGSPNPLLLLPSDTAYLLFSWVAPAALCCGLFASQFTPFAVLATFAITFLCSTPWLWYLPYVQQHEQYKQARDKFEKKQNKHRNIREASANLSGLSAATQSSIVGRTSPNDPQAASSGAAPSQTSSEEAAPASNANGGSSTPLFNQQRQMAPNLQESAQSAVQQIAEPITFQPPAPNIPRP